MTDTRKMTDADLEEILRASDMKETTRASYIRQLRSARRFVNNFSGKPLAYVIVRPTKFGPKMAKNAPYNSLAAYVTVFMTLLRRGRETGLWQTSLKLSEKWNALLHSLRTKSLEHVEQNEPTEREEKAHIPLSEWGAMELKLRPDASQEHLLVAFHALLKPLRGGDLAEVRIGGPDADNYLDLSKRMLTINSHKTSATHHALERLIPTDLMRAIRASLEKEPRTYLFESSYGRPYTRDGFIKWKQRVFLKLFGKPVSTNALRHAYVSELDRNRMSLRALKGEAKEMGHSVMEQSRYVRLAKK